MTKSSEDATAIEDPGAEAYARSNFRADGLRVMYEATGKEPGSIALSDGLLGDELVDIGVDAIWGRVWAREGLSRRDKSLVTLGILIALGSETELQAHVRIAINNGLTQDEISEVLYQAGPYAGYPRAMAARKAARQALGL